MTVSEWKRSRPVWEPDPRRGNTAPAALERERAGYERERRSRAGQRPMTEQGWQGAERREPRWGWDRPGRPGAQSSAERESAGYGWACEGDQRAGSASGRGWDGPRDEPSERGSGRVSFRARPGGPLDERAPDGDGREWWEQPRDTRRLAAHEGDFRGRYRGRGPTGYRRADARIWEEAHGPPGD